MPMIINQYISHAYLIILNVSYMIFIYYIIQLFYVLICMLVEFLPVYWGEHMHKTNI